MLRFVGDLTALRQWVSLGLARLTVAATTSVAALVALAFVNRVLAITAAVVFISGVLVALIVGGRMQKAAKEARRRRSRFAANINEKISSIAVVQAFGQTEREQKRIARQGHRLRNAMIDRASVVGQLRGITEITASFASGAVLLIGVGEVAANRASAGTVVAAMTIVGFLVPALQGLGRVQEYWHKSRVSLQKVQEFLDMPSLVTEAPNASELEPGSGQLEFDRVRFGDALHEISATAEPGKVVGLVGPNGAGKSTLLSLAARLIDPDQGTIRLDRQDLSQHSLGSVRRAIGITSPDLPLLRGTVAKNLCYRWPDAPKEEIARVRSLCDVDSVLAELPEGDQTRVSEGGAGLSAGQRQRIALARAILGNPPLLLLDEIDANLDTRATAVIDRVLSEYQGTVLLITHRAERLTTADIIWYLEEGQLLEVGAPQEVLYGEGAAARFFRSQASGIVASQ